MSPPGGADAASVTDDLRAFLASATGRDELLHIPPTAALFGTAVGLDSLTGTLLLREIQRRFGVDVAAEDLNLDSLATLGTLAAAGFRVPEPAGPDDGGAGGNPATYQRDLSPPLPALPGRVSAPGEPGGDAA